MRSKRASTQPLSTPTLINDPLIQRHTVVLKGLKPATTYMYSVGDGSASGWTEPAEFTTAPASAVPFSFIYISWRFHTPPERLREYMVYLKENNFRCIAVRDLEPYVDRDNLPADPLLKARQPLRATERLVLPVEMEATRHDLGFWLDDMLVYHRFTWDEAARVCGWSAEEIQKKAAELHISPDAAPEKLASGKVRVVPYPGGREVRRGFTDGSIDFQRGTTASVLLP